MGDTQKETNRDTTCDVVLNWVIYNVVYSCIPLLAACIFRWVGHANIDLFKLTPDCLLVGFAISISSRAFIEERDGIEISQKKKSNWGSIPFITCTLCCLLYAGLFGEYSAFSALQETETLFVVIIGVAVAVFVNILAIWHLQAIHDKNQVIKG